MNKTQWWGRIWRTGVVIYTLYMFALIASYMFIAGRSVSYSYTISGQRAVQVGQPTAMRLGVYNIAQGRFLPNTQVQVHFTQGARKDSVFRGVTSPVGLGDVNVKVPAEAQTGEAQWMIRLHPPGLEPQEVSIPIDVAKARPEDPTLLWSEASVQVSNGDKQVIADEGTGPVRLELVADGNKPIDGLRSVFFVQTTLRDSGEPVRVKVKVEVLKGLIDSDPPGDVITDHGGLGFFSVVPVGSQRWKLSTTTKVDGQDVESIREITIESGLTQHSLRLKSPVWSSHEEFQANVNSLRRSGVVYGDFYQGQRWVWGEVTGLGNQGAGFSIPGKAVTRPSEGISLLRFQAYADALQPGKAGDVRYVVLPAEGMSDNDVLRALLDRAIEAGVLEKQAKVMRNLPWLLTTSNEGSLKRHIAFWLSQLPRELKGPTLLKDTQVGDKAQLAEEKSEMRESVTWLVGVSGGLGLLLILYLVVSNLLRTRREGRQALAEAIAEVDDDTAAALLEDRGGLARGEALVQMLLLFGTVAVFFTAIVVLLRHL